MAKASGRGCKHDREPNSSLEVEATTHALVKSKRISLRPVDGGNTYYRACISTTADLIGGQPCAMHECITNKRRLQIMRHDNVKTCGTQRFRG
jgi:hypothetical protein